MMFVACLALPWSAAAQPRPPIRPGVPARPAAPVAPVCPPPPSCPECAACPAPPAPPPPPFRVAVSSAINGGFADITCGAQADHAVGLRVVASQLAAEPEAFALDAGDLLGSSALSRITLQRYAAEVSNAVRASGIRVVAVGHRDLAATRATILDGVRALGEAGVTAVLSNLHCEGDGAALCEVVRDADDPPVIVEHGGERVAVITLLTPASLARVAPDRRAGITLDPLVDAALREVREARAAGATRVVITLDPTVDHESAEAVALVNAFTEVTPPDVFVVSNLPEGVRFMRSARNRALMVRPERGRVVVAEVSPTSTDARDARDGAAPEPVTRFVDEATRWLCEAHGHVLPGGRVRQPMDQDAFTDLLLDVLRDRTRSEIAVINRRAVRRSALFPIREGLSALSVRMAVPFEDHVSVTRIDGETLEDLALHEGLAQMVVRGVTVRGEGDDRTVWVNGRPIDTTASYSLVTTGFVAEGGDGGLDEDLTWRHLHETHQDLLLAWLQTAGADGFLRPPADPAERVRWSFRWNLDGEFSATNIANGDNAVYSDAQLNRAQAMTFRLDTELRADADHPSYTFQNGLRIRYGMIDQEVPGEPRAGFLENLDLTSLLSKAVWRWSRANVRWYHPLPFVEGYVETEMDLPPPDDFGNRRLFHHLQIRPTAGATFQLLPRLNLDLGAGMDLPEVFAPANDRRSSPVFNLLARVTASHGRIFQIGDRDVMGGFSVEASFRDPGDTQDLIVRGSAQISIPLFAPLNLTIGYDVYARNVTAPFVNGTRPANPGFAFAGDGMIGLQIAFTRALQTF